MEETERRQIKLKQMIENAEDSIAGNKIIKELAVLRGMKDKDLEIKEKACDKAIEDDTKYIAELRTLLNENSI